MPPTPPHTGGNHNDNYTLFPNELSVLKAFSARPKQSITTFTQFPLSDYSDYSLSFSFLCISRHIFTVTRFSRRSWLQTVPQPPENHLRGQRLADSPPSTAKYRLAASKSPFHSPPSSRALSTLLTVRLVPPPEIQVSITISRLVAICQLITHTHTYISML